MGKNLTVGDGLEEGMVTYFSILACRISEDRGAWTATVHGVIKSQKTERLNSRENGEKLVT